MQDALHFFDTQEAGKTLVNTLFFDRTTKKQASSEPLRRMKLKLRTFGFLERYISR